MKTLTLQPRSGTLKCQAFLGSRGSAYLLPTIGLFSTPRRVHGPGPASIISRFQAPPGSGTLERYLTSSPNSLPRSDFFIFEIRLEINSVFFSYVSEGGGSRMPSWQVDEIEDMAADLEGSLSGLGADLTAGSYNMRYSRKAK